MSCQSHPHSYLQMPTHGGKGCLFLFKQVTTRTHNVPNSTYPAFTNVFPQYVQLNKNSEGTVNGNHKLVRNGLISKRVNLSGGDYRYGCPVFLRNSHCLHSWDDFSGVKTNVPPNMAYALLSMLNDNKPFTTKKFESATSSPNNMTASQSLKCRFSWHSPCIDLSGEFIIQG